MNIYKIPNKIIKKMTNQNMKAPSIKQLLIVALIYSLIGNFGDIRQGIKDGWNGKTTLSKNR